MKRSLLLALTVILVAGTAFAQLPQEPYIGLFTSDFHDSWCATGSMPFYFTEMWIFCLPNVDGMICAEFAISYPAVGVIPSTVTSNLPIISIQKGDLTTGMSVCYLECQYDWHWCFHQSLVVNAPDPIYAELIPHTAPEITQVQVADCREDFPIIPAIKFTNFYINYDPMTAPECQVAGTESKTWGAIKALTGE